MRFFHNFCLHLLDNTALWPLSLFAPCLVLLMLVRRFCPQGLNKGELTAGYARAISLLLTALGAAMLLCYGYVACAYLRSPLFLNHLAPTLTCASWLFWTGHPIYQDFVTHERYSMLYGPYLYIITGFFEASLGPNLFSAKLPGFLAATGSLVLLFSSLQARTRLPKALFYTGLASALLLHFPYVSYGLRPDPYPLFAVCFGLLVVARKLPFAPLLLGIITSFAVNIKIHSVIYFIPIYGWALLENRWTHRDFLTFLLAGLVVFCLPFLLFKNISFANYLALLHQATGHGLGHAELIGNVIWCLTLFFPVVFLACVRWFLHADSRFHYSRSEIIIVSLVLFSALLMLLPASKNGAGEHHFIPFIPIVIFYLSQIRWENIRYTSPGFALVVSALALSWFACGVLESPTGVHRTRYEINRPSPDMAREIDSIVQAHPDWTILMATSSDDTYDKTYARYELVFQGMPLGIDPGAQMDFQKAGLENIDLDGLIGELNSRYRRPVLWLCARGADPFTVHSYYIEKDQSFPQIFPESFRAAFAKEYRKSDSTSLFDLYTPRVSPWSDRTP